MQLQLYKVELIELQLLHHECIYEPFTRTDLYSVTAIGVQQRSCNSLN